MTISHHPGLETLLSCSAGSQPEAFAAVMASHISICPECRRELALMEKIGAALFDQMSPARVKRDAPVMELRRMEAGVQSSNAQRKPPGGDVPEPLRPILGRYLDDVKWRKLAPGVWDHQIPLSKGAKGDLRLIKVAPGHKLPEHGHEGSELSLLLRGSYADKLGQYSTGDVADLSTDVEHQPVADANEGCICLVATDKQLRFKSLLARLMQPLTGI
jgi:putative transcriptional regulator